MQLNNWRKHSVLLFVSLYVTFFLSSVSFECPVNSEKSFKEVSNVLEKIFKKDSRFQQYYSINQEIWQYAWSSKAIFKLILVALIVEMFLSSQWTKSLGIIYIFIMDRIQNHSHPSLTHFHSRVFDKLKD